MLNWSLRRFLCKLVYFFNGVAMKKIVRTVASMIMVAVMLTGMAGCSSGAVNVKAADLMDGVKADSVTVDKKAFEFAGM